MASNPQISVKKQSTAYSPELLLLAALAGFVVFNFRWDMHRSVLLICIEFIVYFSTPLLFLTWIKRRLHGSVEFTKQNGWLVKIQLGAILFASFPVLMQFITRKFGYGDPFEILALCIMWNATWYLAVFSKIKGFDRVAFIMGTFLVLFVCFMTQNTQSFIFAFLYLAVSLWWLLGNYWERLESKAIDSETRSLPARGLVVALTFLFLICVGTLAMAFGPITTAVGLKGFMPTSGGESWHDTYARSGIGDGDMLTAGDNATTAGAIDSNQMIEDDKPSIYDIMSEKYEGPIKKMKKHRAQALDGLAKHIHDAVKSEQTGRSFRTFRKPAEDQKLELKDRITKALFFVEGTVPARFGIDSFHHFDGWDWTKPDLGDYKTTNPAIANRTIDGKPWYILQKPKKEYLSANKAHRVKIMRLDSQSLPAPPFLKSWHIHRVELEDLFQWNQEGSVVMDGSTIPTHTMIDIVSAIPNHYILRSETILTDHGEVESSGNVIDKWFGVSKKRETKKTATPVQADTKNVSPYLQVAQNKTLTRLEELLEGIKGGTAPGWNQIDLIVNHFRTNYELDAGRVASVEFDDSIESFLDQKGGPSYLFATTATQMLRLAGYQTRLRSGFLVRRKDYDRIARQSIVDSSNLHMWPEICLDGVNWIPVEPTPGYPIPCNTQTIWQWTKIQLANGINWAIGHPLISISTILLTLFSFIYRKQIAISFCWFLWKVTIIGIPANRLKLTRQLLDLRFWAAGLPRPPFAPIESWYSQIDRQGSANFVAQWQQAHFSKKHQRPASKQIQTACTEAVTLLTYRRIRNFANSPNCE